MHTCADVAHMYMCTHHTSDCTYSSPASGEAPPWLARWAQRTEVESDPWQNGGLLSGKNLDWHLTAGGSLSNRWIEKNLGKLLRKFSEKHKKIQEDLRNFWGRLGKTQENCKKSHEGTTSGMDLRKF